MAFTDIANSVKPEVYLAYQQAFTEAKSRLVESGAVARDTVLDQLLVGGGDTFNIPVWNDLSDSDTPNSDTDAQSSAITPVNIDSHKEIAARLNRNQAWGSADLVSRVAGSDPQEAIARRVSPFWTRHLQDTVLAAISGVVKDNVSNDSGDYKIDKTGTFDPNTTAFSAKNFLEAVHTMGDSEGDLGIVVMHARVYRTAQEQALIEFVPDPVNQVAARIPTFLGRRVIVDDNMPKSSNDYTTYILGEGAIRWGVGQPKVPLTTFREELEADGGGREYLISRVEWIVHVAGHAYTGTAPDGGPGNGTGSNNLDNAASWDRRKPERKQVKLAVLETTED